LSFDDWRRDIRYGCRSLARTPAFTAVAVIVLALGIGTNSAAFSLINALVLRPALMEDPEEIVGIYARTIEPPMSWHLFSYPEYREIDELNRTFSEVAAYDLAEVGLLEDGVTRRTGAIFASANYFRTFGVPVAYGREFTVDEERSGNNAAVAVVSHDYWVRNDRDPELLGSVLRINGEPVAVVGIAAEGFTGHTVGIAPDVWMPLGMLERIGGAPSGRRPRLDAREDGTLLLFGRLDDGVSVEQARANLDTLAPRLGGESVEGQGRRTFVLAPLGRFSVGNAPAGDEGGAAVAAALTTMTGIVLLIACINLANMLLARGARRRTEMAIRQALGGGRMRLVRQLMVEAFLLAVCGGAAGVVAGYWATRWLVSAVSASPLGLTVSIGTTDFRPELSVLAATFVVCIVATLLFGLGPSLRVSRDIAGALKEGGERSVSGAGRSGSLLAPRNLMVVGQVALSLALMVAGGLFLRSTLEAGQAHPGFDIDPIVLAQIDPTLLGYDEARTREVYRQALERVRGLPGVEQASMGSLIPYDATIFRTRVNLPGADPADDSPVASYHVVTDDYFATLGLPMLSGRAFTAAEATSERGNPIAIIDEPLAERLFGDPNDALGRYIALPGNTLLEAGQMEIVGIVPGVLDPFRDRAPSPHIYVPLGQHFTAPMHMHIRAAGTIDPETLLGVVRDELLAVDPSLPVLSLTTLAGQRDGSLFMWGVRTTGKIVTVLGALALFLAVVGVYGVKAFLAARRTREVGLRIALGATGRDVIRQMLRESMAVTVAGLAIGLLLSAAISRLVSAGLFGVSPADPLVFVGCTALLAAAAMFAAYLPARRATRTEPTTALRHE